MQLTGKLFFLTAILTRSFYAAAQEDTTMTADCTTGFFQRTEKAANPGKITLVTKTGKISNLAAFLATIRSGSGEYINAPVTADLPQLQDYGMIDLDKDGKKELVISNFTGGAHCCDEFYFFRNTSINKFQYAAKTFAGDVCVNDENEFTFSFTQQLGYFFTCFACGYEDTTDEAPVDIRSIRLRYTKGKLAVQPGDTELRSTITDNLSKLGEQPYIKMEDDIARDNGLRKAFAMNLAVFHFSFGKNLAATRQLFTRYYKFPDATKVWSSFVKELQHIQKENSL